MMVPRSLDHFYPHLLLLAVATAGVFLTMPDSNRDQQSDSVWKPPAPEPAGVEEEINYEYAYVKPSSLADRFEQARRRYEAIQRGLDQDAEEADGEQAALPVELRIETSTWSVDQTYNSPGVYVLVQDSEPDTGLFPQGHLKATRVLRTIPESEYVVLQYGEIGEPETLQPIARRASSSRSVREVRDDDGHEAPAFIGPPGLTDKPRKASEITPRVPIANPKDPATVRTNQDVPQNPTATTDSIQVASDVDPIPTVSDSSVSLTALPEKEPVPTSSAGVPTPTFISQPLAPQINMPEIPSEPDTNRDPNEGYQSQDTIRTAGNPSQDHTDKKPGARPELRPSDPPRVTLPVKEKDVVAPKSDPPKAPVRTAEKTEQTPPRPVASPIKQVPTSDEPDSLVVLVETGDDDSSRLKLKAIDNVVSQINKVAEIADIDIRLDMATAPGAEHHILLREEDDDALGGKLGLARSAAITDDHGREYRLGQDDAELGGQAVASLNKDVKWYFGDDEDDISEDQFDFQTAVTHELLHLLGLDDDFGEKLGKVMHGYLSPGETRRIITELDTRELKSRYAHHNLWDRATEFRKARARGARKGIRYKAEALTAAPVPEPAGAIVLLAGWGVLLHRRQGA